ncbi:MAG TPA: Ig-like domain-containing protein [Patescibacteria group bacterium]|nr:Ig-like domain-containing protein [Patescibacteria group bacterium]
MNSFFDKKIPTIAGLFLLAIAVLATSYLVNTGVILFGGAAPSENPQNVRITNISDTGFTVAYTTEASVIGTLSLQEDGKNQTILDERDQQSGIPQSYTVHSLSVKNATPETTYAFSITSGATTYQNNGNLFSLTTAPAFTASPSATKPLSGKLLQSSGTPAAGILVFVTTKNGQTLSTLTDAQGVYIIPLNAMRTTDMTQPVLFDESSIMQLLATDGKNSSEAQILLNKANPVPLMTLGNSYNFVTSTTPIASTSASLGFPSFPTNNTITATPVIITPKKNEGFTDTQPQFNGKALPNQTVSIEIHSSDVVSATVTSDKSGNWTYRPTTPLSPGQHILSITTKDASGILKTIQQSFTVYASGSQVNQTATPSGQLTATPTPIPTVQPTMQPTPTTFVTPTPTKTTVVSPTAKPTLPPTGSNALITSTILGVATTLIGIVLFVITKGATL